MATVTRFGLPIEEVLGDLDQALAESGRAILEAPPGAGKTTAVPLALLDAAWLRGGKIVIVEPRRVATRAAAIRMAEMRGDAVGGTIGYAMRFERKVSPATRIEVVTEGLFARLLQRDPELTDVVLVIFDEFHERSLDADLGLTLCLDTRRGLRPDLRLLVMSATLPGQELSSLLEDAPLIKSEGRAFPVETRYRPATRGADLWKHMAGVIDEAVRSERRSILAFLPGTNEIRRVRGALGAIPGVDILELHGSLARNAQLEAIRTRASGVRKIVLATNIAETSLTIDDVSIVIDGGLERRPRYSPRTGMSRLELASISRASADQRRGRAGRTGPGICYRLWAEPEDRARPPHHPPEITEADLAPLLLELTAWGVADPSALTWPTPPPKGAIDEARKTLVQLQLIDESRALTPLGRHAIELPLHPRLAAMIVTHPNMTSCMLAAILSARDPWRTRLGSDLGARMEAFARERPPELARVAEQIARRAGIKENDSKATHVGRYLAAAFPDRIARVRARGDRRYQLANGRGAAIDAGDTLAASEWLVIADVDDQGADARIRLAAALNGGEIEAISKDLLETSHVIAWDDRQQAVIAVERTRLGSIVLKDRDLIDPDPNWVVDALVEGLRALGPETLPWTEEARQFLARIKLARTLEPELPDWTEASCLDLIVPYLQGLRSQAEVQAIDLDSCLRQALPFNALKRLDQLAPASITTAAGTSAKIDYRKDPPVLAVKLQALFGWSTTPRILEGRLPLAIELLSPAGRPLQVTQDLEGFWRGSYLEVRKEMRGRYPKHPWPDDPMTAKATLRTKRASTVNRGDGSPP